MTNQSLSNSPHWQPSLSGDGIVTGIQDVQQSMEIILSTLFGDVPHRPDFACDCIALLDSDYDEAAPVFIQRATDAILKFEPRVAELTIISRGGDTPETFSQAVFTINWQPVDNLLPQSFDYQIPDAG